MFRHGAGIYANLATSWQAANPPFHLIFRRSTRNLRAVGQLEQYLPVLILGLITVAFAAGNLLVSLLVSLRFSRRTAAKEPVKDTPYECGMLPEGEGSSRMSVKFYLVAMLFILFDIEVVFLYPWAVVYKDMLATHAGLILGSMLSFLGILIVGYIYAIKKKAFDWKR